MGRSRPACGGSPGCTSGRRRRTATSGPGRCRRRRRPRTRRRPRPRRARRAPTRVDLLAQGEHLVAVLGGQVAELVLHDAGHLVVLGVPASGTPTMTRASRSVGVARSASAARGAGRSAASCPRRLSAKSSPPWSRSARRRRRGRARPGRRCRAWSWRGSPGRRRRRPPRRAAARRWTRRGRTSGRPGPTGVVVGCGTLTACRRFATLSKRLVTDRYQRTAPQHARGGRHAPQHLRRGPRGVPRARSREFVERHAQAPRRGDARGQVDPARHLAGGRQAGPASASTSPRSSAAAGVDDYRFNAVAAEEMSPASTPPSSSCFGIHSDVCPPYIVDLGTEEQKQRWLPGMATGELICAIAMTEPVGRLRPRRPQDHRGRATVDDWVINGSKTFITNGYQRRPGHRRRPHRPGQGRQGHHPVRGRGRHGRASAAAASSTRSARTSPTPPSCSSRTSGSPTPTGSARRAWASSR